MSEQSVKIGDVVFAADLVKVQKGTKYFYITYYDLSSKNVSLKQRIYKAFDLLSTDYPDFKYWNIESLCSIISAENNALMEEGLTSNVSAYMHAQNKFLVTYYNYNLKPLYVETEQLSMLHDVYNEIYLSNCTGEIQTFKTDADYCLKLNPFELSSYRFLGWKKNDYGELMQPDSIDKIQENTDYYANWIKQYWLYIYNNEPKKGTILPFNFKYSPTVFYTDNMYDSGAQMQISSCPAAHYHFVKHSLIYVDEDGNTPREQHTDITEEYGGIATINLSNNVIVNTIFDIDKYNLSFNANVNNVGIVQARIGSKSYENLTTTMMTISGNWNSSLYLYAKSSRLSSFIRWDGNIPNTLIYRQSFMIPLTYDITATAVYMPKNVYSVCVFSNNNGAGTVSTNSDPTTPELPPGMYVQPEPGTTFDVIITASPEAKCEFLYWLDSNGNKYNDKLYTLTNFISCNYQLTAFFDVRLIDDMTIPIIDDIGYPIDYNSDN